MSWDNDKGKEHYIAYGARSLTNARKKWSISEQDMLAVLKGIRSYHIYLSDKKCTIPIDHEGLKYVLDQKRASGRLAKWPWKSKDTCSTSSIDKGNIMR